MKFLSALILMSLIVGCKSPTVGGRVSPGTGTGAPILKMEEYREERRQQRRDYIRERRWISKNTERNND